jgi:hypothetical protein
MEFDLGEKSLNCGRRNDALKLWATWIVNGDKVGKKKLHFFFY